jgi:hypothetical protein
MSNRAASFVEQWVSENAVKPVEGALAGDDSEARLARKRVWQQPGMKALRARK